MVPWRSPEPQVKASERVGKPDFSTAHPPSSWEVLPAISGWLAHRKAQGPVSCSLTCEAVLEGVWVGMGLLEAPEVVLQWDDQVRRAVVSKYKAGPTLPADLEKVRDTTSPKPE